MGTAHLERPATRRVAELVLAVLAVLLAAGIVTESPMLFDSVLGLLWLPAAILVPGLLAVSVLVGALAHGIRLASAVLGAGDRIRPGDTAATISSGRWNQCKCVSRALDSVGAGCSSGRTR